MRKLLSILLVSLALAGSLPAANRAAQSAQYEALPLMRSRQNHLLVRAFINGKEAWLGVDSGAPVSAIALNRRQHFGLSGIPTSSKLPARLQINGAFNNVAIARNFRLGNLNLVDEPVVTVDLRSTRSARWLAMNASLSRSTSKRALPVAASWKRCAATSACSP